MEDYSLLQELCSVHAPSGNESELTKFLLNHIEKDSKNWKRRPEVYSGGQFQDSVVLVFGKPRTAIFAHIDSIGFTVRYGKELIKIGSPKVKSGYKLNGFDSQGEIECTLQIQEEDKIAYVNNRILDRGTTLTFKPDFRNTDNYIQSCYLDNRLGVWSALQVARELSDGIIAFSCYEEHGGGSAEFLGKFIYEKFNVTQALISDITWITEGVSHGKGVVISLRDSGIPRRTYVEKIIRIAHRQQIPFQLEVESSGGSDGNALQRSPYPFDWCFIGAPEDHVHSPDEKVHKQDIGSMVDLYKVLMNEL